MNEKEVPNPGEPDSSAKRQTFFRFWRCFWLLFLVASLAYAWHCFYVPANHVTWAGSYSEAKKQAVDTDRPMVLFFTGKWCVPCRVMKREVWADREVMELVNERFIPLTIDVDQPENSDLLGQYQIGTTPVTIVTNSQGNALDWRIGGISKPEFLELLNAPETRAAPRPK